jgi:hypothetical protein
MVSGPKASAIPRAVASRPGTHGLGSERHARATGRRLRRLAARGRGGRSRLRAGPPQRRPAHARLRARAARRVSRRAAGCARDRACPGGLAEATGGARCRRSGWSLRGHRGAPREQAGTRAARATPGASRRRPDRGHARCRGAQAHAVDSSGATPAVIAMAGRAASVLSAQLVLAHAANELIPSFASTDQENALRAWARARRA